MSAPTAVPVCRAPMVSLNLDPLGAVRACCMSPWYVLGRIGDARLPEIWRDARAEELRRRLTDGDLSAGCDACREPIEAGERHRSFARVFDDLPLHRADPHDGWPAQLELALSNTCNLQCTMCNGTLSSAIRAGREGLPPLPVVYDDQFFEDLVPFLQHVERISFLGGESLLARETWRVIELLRSLDLRPRLEVTTNGTIWNDRVARLLADFATHVIVSVDALEPDTMRSIRVGVDPDRVWEHLDRFRVAAPAGGGSTAIAHCLMADNWHELHGLLLRADRLDLDVFVNDVTWPTTHALGALSQAALVEVIEQLQEQEAAGPPLGRNRSAWTGALATLRALAERTPVSVTIGPTRSTDIRITAEFLVDERQTLVRVAPDASDVFGVDLTGTLGHPVGEWMEHFQAVHGDLRRSAVARTEGGGERWTLEVEGSNGPGHLEAEFTPDPDGGGTWRLALSRPR